MFKVGVNLFSLGNGVVIHLPGLFEEAEKNVKKGKGKRMSLHCLVTGDFFCKVLFGFHGSHSTF